MVGKRAFHSPHGVGPDEPADVEVVPAARAGRTWTVSLAVAASILQNAQSPELEMYLAGQVARAAAIFRVDEVVVFAEGASPALARAQRHGRRARARDPLQLARFFCNVLQYAETPQYLRRHLFPVSAELRLVGLLNPLALPSHAARGDAPRFREGVAVDRHGFARADGAPTRFVDVGVDKLAEVDRALEPGARVTVDLAQSGPGYERCAGKYLYGAVVERAAPARADGTYWGYQTRLAPSLADVFAGSEVCERYDLVLGTSERGAVLGGRGADGLPALPGFRHALVVFGGVQGLEFAARGDARLRELGMGRDADGDGDGDGDGAAAAEGGVDVGELFDFYINTCADQGSRTIRTEEAILITMAALQPYLRPREK